MSQGPSNAIGIWDSNLHLDNHPISDLTTPPASTPQETTIITPLFEISGGHSGVIGGGGGVVGNSSPVMTSIVSPPTPAPSPRPDISNELDPFSTQSSTSTQQDDQDDNADDLNFTRDVSIAFQRLDSSARRRFLSDLLSNCDIDQLVFISNIIAPRLKRDFLKELPIEISLHILSFIDDPKSLARAACVSRFWKGLVNDEFTWKIMCFKHNFTGSLKEAKRLVWEGKGKGSALAAPGPSSQIWELSSVGLEMGLGSRMSIDGDSDTERTASASISSAEERDSDSRPSSSTIIPSRSNSLLASSTSFALPSASSSTTTSPIIRSPRTNRPIIESKRALSAPKNRKPKLPTKVEEHFSYRRHFKSAYLTEANWRRGGRVLKSHTSADDGVVTSVAMNDEWIVAGLVNHRVHVFAADTGLHVRTLVGHTQGVWCLNLVSKGTSGAGASGMDMGSGSSTPSGEWDGSMPLPTFGTHLKPSDVCNTSVGWGQSMSLVVSGGCDRELRVWDLTTGACMHSLKGHTSTIRCLKVLDGRPIAVSGSRDASLRVWDIQQGECLHVLSGHTNSVRCLDVAGNIAVSGSYDCTARLWNVDTGECLREFTGHYHQIYAVAFDGIRVATGSLDSTVRVWSPETGECTAVLQGHTSLVGQLQLLGTTLVSGGSDGRVIIFSLTTFETLNRICAHDNSVTCLQFDDRFLITGGNDGHVKLFEIGSGVPIRELTEPCEAVWRVNFKHDKCVIMCKRGGKTVMEILSFRPPEDQLI